MNEESLETVAEEFEDITIESAENYYIIGNGERIDADNPLPVQIVYPDEDSSSSEDESESSIEIQYFEEATEAGDNIILNNVKSAKSVTASVSGPSFKNLWKIRVNGSEYSVLFPQNASLSVVDGKLYNIGSSSVSGSVIDSSFSDSDYIKRTFTILPVAGTSSQSTVHRYGSRQYFTDYSVGYNDSLSTSVYYVQADVVHRPIGWSLSPAYLVVCGLLLFSILISILGGIVRR